ncbi:MAG: DUF5666 domain-containing protein [Gammaproteobacteria bacterium]
MVTKIFRSLMTSLAIICLAACGGSSGGGGLAGGGVSGTGIGTITGFGSVKINVARDFATDSNTLFFLDDEPVADQATLEALLCGGIACGATNPGIVARVDIGADVNADFTSGTAVSVNAFNLVKGPVTGVNPLRVLEQTIILTGDTVLADVPGNNVANLVPGDIVEVSGFADGNNVIQASRLEFKPAGAPVWKLTGPAGNVIPNASFQIGSQLVLLNGVVPRDCVGGLIGGDLVEVKATQDPGFAPGGDTLDTVTDVECQVPGLGVPGNANGNVLDAEVEGIVTVINGPGDFVINGQRMVTNAGTLFEGGAAEDIVIGAKLEAEGDLDLVTGILAADKIKFRETRARIEAPVNIPGGGVGSSFTIMDVITVNTTSLTEDDDGIIDGSGNSGNRQVEVRGFVDSTGSVFATELRDRGQADTTDVRLRGPTTDTCDPLSGDTELLILGVTVDTDSAAIPLAYFNETVEPPVQLANNTALCALISAGSGVEVENGVFTSGPPRIDDAEQYSIEDL